MMKKVVAFIMALALAGGCFMGMTDKAFAANEERQVKMEDVLLKVKTKLELDDDEYTNFSYRYDTYSQISKWFFDWSSEDGSKSISLSCDDDAHILNISSYDNDQYGASIPDKTGAEVEPEAQKLIERLFPEAAGHIVLKRTYCQYYRRSYQYSYNRIENGIEMPDNTLRISVDFVTGQIRDALCSWNYTAKVPAAKNLISADEAKEKIGTKVDMELQYLLGYDDEGNERVFLAYIPSKSYVAVNAKNGKIYTQKNYWDADPGWKESFDSDEAVAEEARAANGEDSGYTAKISDAEKAKIEDLGKLIGSEDAVKLVKENKWLLIDENLNTVQTNLNFYNDRYYWYITLSDNRPYDDNETDYYRAYVSATVDAEDGTLIRFYASTKGLDYYQDIDVDSIKFDYTKSECKKIFAGFAKETAGEKYEKTKLKDVNAERSYFYDDGTERKVTTAYSYSYIRYNEDVPFYANGIRGAVDRITGKVYSYSFNWSDAELPSTKGVIGEQKAFDSYMSYEGYDLVYELVSNTKKSTSIMGYEREEAVRLVYRTSISPAYVDAFTGKQLTYDGQEYEKARTDFEYNDIAGTKYEKAILILAGMGIGLPGESFMPGKTITKAEFLKYAQGFGMLNNKYGDEEEDDEKLTREKVAKEAVKLLGYDKIASLDIYKLDYKDSAKVGNEYKGYVAIAGGLDLIKADKNGEIKPAKEFSRGEAAELLLNMARHASSMEQ